MRTRDQILLENLYEREVLTEKRKERLLPMFNKIIQKLVNLEDGFPLQYDDRNVRAEYQDKGESEEEYRQKLKEYNKEELTDKIQNLIKQVSVTAKKENLVMIILKDFVALMEREYEGMDQYGVIFQGDLDDEADLTTSSKEYFYAYLKSFANHATELQHLLSLPIPELQEYLRTVSPNEKWYIVARTSRELEKEWQNRSKNWIDVTDEINKRSIEEFLKFKNNMAWFNLHRPYCQDEGLAMGHCGNTATFAYSDTVLSLRQTKKEKNNTVLSKPYLTFILKSGQYLGEMKGRANSKPIPEYHPYIMELLLYKQNGKYFISGIEGGGYAPERNFDIEDLSDQLLKQLADERPTLIADKADDYIKKKKQFSDKLKKAINSSSRKRDILQEIRYRFELSSRTREFVASTMLAPTKIHKISIKDNLNVIYEPQSEPNYPLEA